MKKKNSKIRKFFREAFSTRRTKVAFFACVLSVLLLIGVTFAWFFSIIELPQSEIKTGTIEYVVKGYDKDGNFISTIIDPEKVTNDTVYPNHPLFTFDDLSANKYTTAYISIETTGTLDMEYSLMFNVIGLENEIKTLVDFGIKLRR